ncbi:MAG: glycosyltransferase family 4 protein [Colwellia sp.]|nr:glycosyltransferase family 4 protein [Colwellia sp.]
MEQLLIIGYVWPEPNSSAAGSKMMQLIAFFQRKNYQITFASPAQFSDHMADLKALAINVEPIALNCGSFDVFINKLKPSVVLFDRFMMEEQFGWRVSEQCPQAIRILDSEDLFCLRHARHDAFKQNRELLDSDLLTSELAKREVAAIFRCDLSLIISQVEIELLQRLFKVPAYLLHYSPFMFTESELHLDNPNYQQRQHFISIGNFRHAPNWDAVLWLKQQVWPLIRAKLPEAQLLIYGAYPPPKATALHDEKSGFLVKGWVDNAEQAMQTARVCLAPLRFGAGIKGKLAQAMICGTPSVTTDIGAESMQSLQPWGGAIANDIETMAENAVELYQNSTLWQKASTNGVTNAQTMYQLDEHFSKFSIILTKLEDNLVTLRQQNFIGSMLNHHAHKSTKYMAQWIEAKNKL